MWTAEKTLLGYKSKDFTLPWDFQEPCVYSHSVSLQAQCSSFTCFLLRVWKKFILPQSPQGHQAGSLGRPPWGSKHSLSHYTASMQTPGKKTSRSLSGACLGSSHSNKATSGPPLAVVQAVLGTDGNRPQAQLSWMILAKEPHLLMSQNSDSTLKLSSSAQSCTSVACSPCLGSVLRRSLCMPVPWTSLPLCSPGHPFPATVHETRESALCGSFVRKMVEDQKLY